MYRVELNAMDIAEINYRREKDEPIFMSVGFYQTGHR